MSNPGGIMSDVKIPEALTDAVAAERKRCEDIASERVAVLFAGANAIPADGQFASQMVEALLIFQRIASGYVAKEPAALDDFRPKVQPKPGGVPSGYSELPAGVRCRCVRLWTDGERHYCCNLGRGLIGEPQAIRSSHE